MLVLSRKVGQSIVIGEGIEITVVEMRGDQVRLGIDAPREVPINRKEILERMRQDPHPPAAPPASADGAAPFASAPATANEVLNRSAESLSEGIPARVPSAARV